ncbi:MAG: DNA alkylation repair protein [Nitrospirota bacterium]
MAGTLNRLKKDLQKLADPQKASILSRFFKTGKGEYGEGDVFLGIPVPEQRKVAKRYSSLSFPEIQTLLSSRIHEHRLAALLILVIRFKSANDAGRQKIVEFYLGNTKRVNNWDLVDLSAEKILGEYLLERDKSAIYGLAQSDNVWARRIAVISTFAFIKRHRFEDTLRLAEQLMNDRHDLIQKAVGWMLREIGKRDQEAEEGFLRKYHRAMPRTMLRYAIERFDQEKRDEYLGKIQIVQTKEKKAI